MTNSQIALWRRKIEEKPIQGCGRLDMSTSLSEPATVGRVTHDRIRYVYFEDDEFETVVLGPGADFVAFKAADYKKRVGSLSEAMGRIVMTLRQHGVDPNCVRVVEKIVEDQGVLPS